MPFIRITTNEQIDKSQEKLMTMELGVAIECISGKTERWLMLEFKGEARMAFGGSDAGCAMVEVDLYGAADPVEKNNLTKQLSNVINLSLGIPSDRIYVRYFETDSWGYAGSNL